MKKDADKWHRIIYDAICSKHESRSVFVSVIDESTTELMAFQVGGDVDRVFDHISLLLSSNARKDIINNIINNVGDEVLEEIAETIEESLEGKNKETHNDYGHVPCRMCAWFEEERLGFGQCVHHQGAFDGEEANRVVNGKSCGYYERKNEG